MALSWKFAADEAQTPGERKFLRWAGRRQVLLLLVLLVLSAVPMVLSLSGGIGLVWLPVALFALLILTIVVNNVFLLPWMVRRQVEIRIEAGDWPPAPADEQKGTEHTTALRKACKHMLPSLVMVAACVFFLPWKKNWLGCVAYLGLFMIPLLLHARRLYRQFRGQHPPNSRWTKKLTKRPLLSMAAIMFLMILFCILGSNLAVRYLAWLNTGTWPDLPLLSTPTRNLLLGLVVAAMVFALVVVAARRLRLTLAGMAGKLGLLFLEQILTSVNAPGAILESQYKPLFEQLSLDPERTRRLKNFLFKRATLGMHAGMPLMNPCLDSETRASLLSDVQADKDACAAQIRELLGERFALFQKFEKGMMDRMLLDQFASKAKHTPRALNEEQRRRLLEARLEARRCFPWTSDLARQNQNARLSEVFTPASLESYVREQSEFDGQFLEQARQLLSPEQLALLEELQTKQRKSQTGLFRMGLKMFGNAASPAPP